MVPLIDRQQSFTVGRGSGEHGQQWRKPSKYAPPRMQKSIPKAHGCPWEALRCEMLKDLTFGRSAISTPSASERLGAGTAKRNEPTLKQIPNQLQLTKLNSHDTIPFTASEIVLLSQIFFTPGRFSQRGRRPGQSHSRLTSRLHGPGGISTPGSAAVRHGLRLEVQS